MENNITLDEKIRLLKIFLNKNNDQEKIDKIFNTYNEVVNDIKKDELLGDKELKIIKTKKNLDKGSYKYIMFLKLLNKILIENGTNNIEDIYDFKNITKEQLIKNREANNLFGMEEQLFKKKEGFNKNKCQWYFKHRIDTYIISFIRGACEELGCQLECKYKRKAVDSEIIHYVIYSIK